MNPLILAQEIIDGRRITRKDDLSFFLTCDLDELCEGADRIREAYIGDKVDLCSIINAAAAGVRRTANIVLSQYTTILPVKSMIFFPRKRFWKHVK